MQRRTKEDAKTKKRIRQHIKAPAYTGPNMARLHIAAYDNYAKEHVRKRRRKNKNQVQEDLVSESNEQDS